MSRTVILAVLVAGLSALVFGLSTSLQHRAGGAAGNPSTSTLRWLRQLTRRPSWLIGIGLSAVAFGLHAAALSLGSLALVQPIVVSATVFAVLIRATLDRRLPAAWEVGWATCTTAGLALFLSATSFQHQQPTADPAAAGILVTAGGLVAGACARMARHSTSPSRRGMWWGAAAGVLFGLVAGLLKIIIGQAPSGLTEVVGQWPVWALLVTGAWAVLLNQRAYRVAQLSVSMPVLNLVDVLTALVFATTVFGERLFTTPLTVTAQLVGIAAIGAGISRLARPPHSPRPRAAPIPDAAVASATPIVGTRRRHAAP